MTREQEMLREDLKKNMKKKRKRKICVESNGKLREM